MAGARHFRKISVKTAVAVGVLLASAILAVLHAWFVPLGIDGGWYSYPGYALSMGRDPAENLLPVAAVYELPGSVRALFGYELRSFLIVPIYAAWFTVAGTSVLSLKIFGALQWMLLAATVGACVYVATNRRGVACAAALATLSDSWVISQSMTDLRPDIPNALAAVFCTLALLIYQRTTRLAWLAIATVLAMGLALVHLTSVIGLMFISTLALVLAVWPRDTGRRHLELLIVPIAAGAAFLLRQPIMDFVVPTKFLPTEELPFRDDLWALFQDIVRQGFSAKLMFELERWRDYFLIGNVTQLMFIVVGVVALVITRQVRRDPVSAAFAVAAAVTIPMAMLIDPSSTRGHLAPLACLGYVAAGIGLAAALRSSLAPHAIRTVLVIGIMAIGVRTAMAANLVRWHVTAGVSNPHLVRFMNEVLEPDSHQTVIAPTYLWPYAHRNGSVVLVEPGSQLWHPEDERWQFVSKVIIDRDFGHRGWSEFSARMERCSSFVKERSVGLPDRGGFFLEAYRVIARPCSQLGD